MPEYRTLVDLVSAASAHVRETGHEMIVADSIPERKLGFVCSTCTVSDNYWSIKLETIQHPEVTLSDGEVTLREYIRTINGRARLCARINEEASNVMFDQLEGSGEDLPFLPDLFSDDSVAEGVEQLNQKNLLPSV
jgi:hypothetical protein